MSIRSSILTAIEEIGAAQKKPLAPLTDDLALTNSGLDSLCFALLVARLEDETGRDPFSESDEVSFPVTLGEFIALYEHAPAV
jgi:acyl carrier protein